MFEEKRWLYVCVFCVVLFCGIFLRLQLYFYNPGLHCDEASLALNLFDASYIDLFKPLIRLQVAPPLFLVISKYFYRLVNFNYTYDFSALMLRFIPLVSGIIAIPALGYLLQILFKNKFITILGMLLLAVNACAISYSCIFKQYSTEMLVTILIMILFVSLKEQEKYKFLLLGLMPFFSLSSFFILPGIVVKICEMFNKEGFNLKRIITGFIYFILPLLIFTFMVLIPVYNTHYERMENYWVNSFSIATTFINYVKSVTYYLFRVSFIHILGGYTLLSLIIMAFKKRTLFFYIFIPLLLVYLSTINKYYPLSERFLLFLLPLFIIAIVYPLSLIPENIFNKYKFVFYFLLICFSCFLIAKLPPVYLINLKQEYGKEAWEYLYKVYDGKNPVIMGRNTATNLFYRLFYGNKFNYYDQAFISYDTSTSYVIKSLPKGTYYIVLTREDVPEACEELKNYLASATKILEQKEFFAPSAPYILDAPPSLVVKFEK